MALQIPFIQAIHTDR